MTDPSQAREVRRLMGVLPETASRPEEPGREAGFRAGAGQCVIKAAVGGAGVTVGSAGGCDRSVMMR